MNLSRFENLVGNENINKIKKLKILIIGLGGVGGYTIESLVRSGIENITLVDDDTIKPSNINRQLIVTTKNMNKYKTKEWKKRIKLINKDAKVNIINTRISEENIEVVFSDNYDYIIDACDTSKVKAELIRRCHDKKIKLVSVMGTAKKIDATKLIITTLDKTNTDPLAKRLRVLLGKEKDLMKEVTVVTSTEKALNVVELGSTSYVPAVAGLLVTNYIINDVIKK